MKWILTTVSVVLVAAVSQAQQVKFGINAGAIDSDILLEIRGSGGGKIHMRKAGFQGGVSADISFNPNFSVQPRLMFITKGGKLVTTESTAGVSITSLDLPVHLVYHHKGFFLGAGPNISYGLAAKEIAEGGAVTPSQSEDLYKDTSSITTGIILKRLDIGLTATMGYEFPGGFLISVNYLKGLSDINKTGNIRVKNCFYGISLGYFLQRKTKQ